LGPSTRKCSWRWPIFTCRATSIVRRFSSIGPHRCESRVLFRGVNACRRIKVIIPAKEARMIGKLTGTLADKNPPQVLVDCNGVGYEVDVPMSTFYNLPGLGDKVSLLTHFVVREDA